MNTASQGTPCRTPDQFPVAVVTGDDAFSCLQKALRDSGFWFALEQSRFASGCDKAEFSIVIKPDFNGLELAGSTCTDARLVEHLIDLLQRQGYQQITVVESRNSYDLWLENRDVQILADLLGYQYITADGHEYDILDLAESASACPFAEGSLLEQTLLPQVWLEAGFRIVFAKNKTDQENGYYLCLNNLLSLLPLRDKNTHYHYRLGQAQVLSELLPHSKVDFCLLDAFVSNQGNGGGEVAYPVQTQTIIAGKDLLQTDWVAAQKMGLDFSVSPVHSQAVARLPIAPPNSLSTNSVVGDLCPYPAWRNVDAGLADAVRQRRCWPQVSQFMDPWLLVVDTEVFPFKDPVNAQINRFVSSYLTQLDSNPQVLWGFIALNLLLARIGEALNAMQTLLWKDRLMYQAAPLNIDPHQFCEQDYLAIASYLNPLQQSIQHLPCDHNGLRWSFHHDGSVLFEIERLIPVAFDDFICRVDISKSIQYMNDYIGGTLLPRQMDDRGRVLYQVERNLYLPQPNYLIFYRGKNIDVSKLEAMEYSVDYQQMVWKTVFSENDSASFDDGSVRFERSPNGETLVRIFGRQQFTLPLFWQWVNLDNYPVLKERLFTWTYTEFFSNTLANFEAVYQGRAVRIGKEWNPLAGEVDDAAEGPAARLTSLVTELQDLLQRYLPDNKESLLKNLFSTYNPQPDFVDEFGFAHFKHPDMHAGQSAVSASYTTGEDNIKSLLNNGRQLATGFWRELYDAMRKDAGVL